MKRRVVWTLVVLGLVAGCGVDQDKLRVVEDEVAAVSSIALLNPSLSALQKSRLEADVVKLKGNLEELGK